MVLNEVKLTDRQNEYSYPTANLFNETNFKKVAFLIAAANDDLKILWGTQNDKVLLKNLSDLKSVLVHDKGVSHSGSFINQLLISLLLTKHPAQLKIVLFDYTNAYLEKYALIKHHFIATLPGEENSIITDSKRMFATLKGLCVELANRIDLLKEALAGDINGYNKKWTNGLLEETKGHQYLPFIVLVLHNMDSYIFDFNPEGFTALHTLREEGPTVGIYIVASAGHYSGDPCFKAPSGEWQHKVIIKWGYADGKRYPSTSEFKHIEKDYAQTTGLIIFNEIEIENVIGHIQRQNKCCSPFFLPESFVETHI